MRVPIIESFLKPSTDRSSSEKANFTAIRTVFFASCQIQVKKKFLSHPLPSFPPFSLRSLLPKGRKEGRGEESSEKRVTLLKYAFFAPKRCARKNRSYNRIVPITRCSYNRGGTVVALKVYFYPIPLPPPK